MTIVVARSFRYDIDNVDARVSNSSFIAVVRFDLTAGRRCSTFTRNILLSPAHADHTAHQWAQSAGRHTGQGALHQRTVPDSP